MEDYRPSVPRKEIDELKEQLEQHIKWNEEHSKARVIMMNEIAQLKETLKFLINQIEISDYQDSGGHSLKINVAFIEAKGLIKNE